MTAHPQHLRAVSAAVDVTSFAWAPVCSPSTVSRKVLHIEPGGSGCGESVDRMMSHAGHQQHMPWCRLSGPRHNNKLGMPSVSRSQQRRLWRLSGRLHECCMA